MTQVSTGGPYIAREVHEAALKVKDGIILELFSRIEELEKRYICKDGKVEPRLKVDPFSGKLIPWSDEQEAFFEPWSKLGLDGKIPLEPGEGWEFLPYDSNREEGDEFWSLYSGHWEVSVNKGRTSLPCLTVGPYRRRIKGRWHTPMGSPPGTQVLLDKPVKQEPTQLPNCPKCGGKPMLLVENRGMKNKHSWVQCTECKSRTVVRSIEALSVRDWKNGDIWSEPATGESPPISPEAAPDHGPVDIDGTKLVPGTRVLVHFSEGTREGVVVRPFPEQPTSHQAGCWVDVSVEGEGPEGIPSYILEVVREVCCDDSIIPATPSAAVVASDPVAECSSCRGEGAVPTMFAISGTRVCDAEEPAKSQRTGGR